MPKQQARRRVSLDGTVVDARSAARESRSFFTRRKTVLAVLVAPIVAIAAITQGMASANACHPLIQAGADCNGTVSYTATAWNDADATDVTRTNTNVQVQYSINGVDGPFVNAESAKGQFNKENGFSFSGTFALPDNLKRPTDVTIQAVALSKWGPNADFDAANQSQKTTIHVPGECAAPSAKVVAPGCASRTAHAILNNNGEEPVEFTLYRNNDSKPFATYTVNKGSVSKDIAVDSKFDLSIKAKDMTPITQTLETTDSCVQVTSTVSKACKADASGWNVVYDNSANSDERMFTLKSGDRVLDTVTVGAGKKETKNYGFSSNGVASGSTVPIAVTADGKTVATETVTNDCVSVSADAVAACNTAAGSGALLSFTNTGQVADTFTVVRDGKAVDGSPFTLEPSGQITQKLLKLNEDESAVVTIMSSSGLNVQKQVTLDCVANTGKPAEVKAEIINRPHLADTGISVVPISGLGGLLTLAGAGLLSLRRKL